jgi:SAM-dependent methyltransferase/uncharacterized protein YbaR (Trm112 family)
MARWAPEALLQCPACRQGALREEQGQYRCDTCPALYPAVGGVPWLFPDPGRALGDWRNRLSLYLDEFDAAARDAEAELTRVPAGRARSRVATLAAAYRAQRQSITQLLEPLAIAQLPLPHATPLAFATRLPLGQDLHSYYPNLHRDWAWGGAENAALHDRVAESLGGTRDRILVLGAGAGRLPYDLHQNGASALTVALDINPLLLLSARRISRGEVLELHEFPIAPRSAADVAVLRQLSAPAPARAGLEFVFADAFTAPFRPQSFDAVVTPWLMDIVDAPPAALASAVNRLLVPGGRWINVGSLAFPWRQASRRMAPDEVLEALAEAGFADIVSGDEDLPYMASPASRHSRIERVFWFHADKARRAPREMEVAASLRDWLEDTSLKVPAGDALALAAESARIRAVVLALADGTRSIDEIVGIVTQEGLLPPAQARSAVLALLERVVEEGARASGPAS